MFAQKTEIDCVQIKSRILFILIYARETINKPDGGKIFWNNDTKE